MLLTEKLTKKQYYDINEEKYVFLAHEQDDSESVEHKVIYAKTSKNCDTYRIFPTFKALSASHVP